MKLDFDLNDCVKKIKKGRSYFHTFLNRPSLAAGVLVLMPGEDDTQEPHDADELYYVVSGDGYLRIGSKDYAVSEGKMFFVARDVEHHFYGNKRELRVIYFFGGPDT